MKPYGREKKIKGCGRWKKDYHIHSKHHHKVGNWWEDFCTTISRSAMKLKLKLNLRKDS